MAGVSKRFSKLATRAAEELIQENEGVVTKNTAGAFGREVIPESAEAERLRRAIHLNDAVAASAKNAEETGDAQRARDIEKAWKHYEALPKEKKTPEAEKALVEKVPEISEYFAKSKDIKGFTAGRPELAPLELPGSYPSVAKKESFSGMTPAQPKSSLDALSSKARKGLGLAETGLLLGAPAAALGAGAYGMSRMGEQPEAPFASGEVSAKSSVAAPPTPAPEEAAAPLPEEAKPEEPSGDTGSIKAPRSPEDMTDLNAKIQEMADSYGEHGKALRAEADGLNAQLNTLRSNFQGEMQAARNDYERQRTQQQWAQVGELIGRSLITMAAAARSLQKGKNFVTGLDPRSQVDWLSQLREARADMQDRIDASKATMNMGAESAEEQSKARLAEKGLAWEGKKLSLREQIAGIKGDMQRRQEIEDQDMRSSIAEEKYQRRLGETEKSDAKREQRLQEQAEQRAMVGRIAQAAKESGGVDKKLSSALDKALGSKEGSQRESQIINLRDALLSGEPRLVEKFDRIVKENSNSFWPDKGEPNYDSPRLIRVKDQLLNVLKESAAFKREATPEVSWKDYQKKWGNTGLNSDEIQAAAESPATEESSATQGAPGSSPDNPARPRTPEEVMALPKGTWIINQRTGKPQQR